MRKSKREINHELEDIEAEHPDQAGLITVLSAAHSDDGEVRAIDGRPDMVRVNGRVRRLTPKAQDYLQHHLRGGT